MHRKISILLSLMITIFVCAFFESVFCESGARCVTPQGQAGACITVFKCQAYYDVFENVSNPRSPEVLELQQRYICEGNASGKVCCPFEDGGDPDAVYREPPPVVAFHKNLRLLPSNCGYFQKPPLVSTYSYGGNKTRLLEFPWMALISTDERNKREFTCGGTIINDRYILTAAHCITNLGAKVLAGVRVGEHDYSKRLDCETIFQTTYCNPPVQDFYVEKIIPHPGYVGFRAASLPRLQNDIALLRLRGSINLTRANAKPVCLPISQELQEMSLDWEHLVLPGWGLTNKDEGGNLLARGDRPSVDLLKISVPVISNKKCGDIYNRSIADGVGFRQLCAGGQQGISSCNGDSGGPLLFAIKVGDEYKYVQFGVISGGARKCGVKNAPAVYNRVAYYMDWILDQLEP